MHKNFNVTFLLLFLSTITTAQTISSVVLDSVSKQPIPFASVHIAKKGVITNEDGRFSLILPENWSKSDTLFISSMGYETIQKPISEFTESIIHMQPKAIELNQVVVTNKSYSGKELLELVNENLDKNYANTLSKKRVFLRDAFHQNMSKLDHTFKNSTIDEIDSKFIDSILKAVPKQYSAYYESLSDSYENTTEEPNKLELIKASELYDKNDMLNYEQIEERFNKIIKKHVKPNSYFKIRSGILPMGKIEGEEFDTFFESEVDSTDAEALKKEIQKNAEEEKERKANFFANRKRVINALLKEQIHHADTPYDFVVKPRKYNYEVSNLAYLGDAIVYVVNFKPKRSATYEGTLYIDAEDFAVVRTYFTNIESLKKFSLLGLKMNQYLRSGKQIYSKKEDGRYGLQYLELEQGVRVDIKRPIKIIEMNKVVKGKNKQNELSLKIDFAINAQTKREFVVFSEETISPSDFEAVIENKEILPTYMPQYDSEFWKGHNIIEPNQAIRDFKARPAD